MASDTSREYIKREENSEVLEIYDQIKKQADYLSTSEASQILKNLSNPTNLTNPQIIGFSHSNLNNNNEMNSSKILKRNINKTINKLHKNQSYGNIRKKFLLTREIKRKALFDHLIKDNDKRKVIKNIKNKFEEKNLDSSNYLDENKTTEKDISIDPIWPKLKSSLSLKNKNKAIRIDFTKNTFRRNYINDFKEISFLKFRVENKIERYERLKKMHKSELSMIDKTQEKIQNSKIYIDDNYYNNFISYIIFLNRKVEKEKNDLYELFINEIKIKKEINQLHNNIDKLIKNKYNILLWISLGIKIKEKILKIPDYYFKIFEENDYYKIYNNKKKFDFGNTTNQEKEKGDITKLCKEKILNYKYNGIFNNADEFLKEYDILEKKWLEGLNKYHNILNEMEELKKEYNSLAELDKYEEEKNAFIQKLDIVKDLNSKLKSELTKTRANFLFYNKIGLIKNRKYRKSLSSSSSSFDITDSIKYSKHINNSLNKLKKIPNVFKNSFLYSFSKSNKNLFSLIINLYYLIEESNLIEFPKYEINSKNNNPILIIMKFIEKAVHLLIDGKKKYCDNPILFQKYETIQNEVIKENKKLKFINLLRIKDAKQKEKILQMAEKINKKIIFPTRQIDYSFMDKINKIKKKKEIYNIKLERKNKNISFEDFMYDL